MFRTFATRQANRLIVDGLLALAVGMAMVLFPGATALTAVGLVAVWSAVNGLTDLGAGLGAARSGGRAWPLVINGLLAIATTILVLTAPVATLLGIATLVGIWQLLVGTNDLVSAIRHETADRGLLIVSSIFRMIAGALFVAMPGVGIRVTIGLVAFGALVLGTTLVAAGIAVRSRVHAIEAGPEAPRHATVEREGRAATAR